MYSRASLNHVYRTVWNHALGAMVAVPENASAGGGRSRGAGGGANPFGAVPLALALSVALAWGGAPGMAHANPQGGVAVQGQASITSNGNQLLVTTQNAAGTSYSAINWQSFSIPAGSSTYFQQPTAASTVINRVVTSTPSLIFGTLGSNGNLVLVNQSGITVGAGAVVDTAGFTASALRMSDADALAGRMRFGDGASAAGTVSVQGSILARNGDVVLLAGAIDTSRDALIQAPNGNTILAAGQQIEITGRGLEGIALQVQAPADSVVNLGTLQGDAVGIFAGTLKHSGVIQADAVTTEGGKVFLKARERLEVDGSVQAKALAQRGGSILASARQVSLGSTALLDASGALGGGEVLVGGGYQGHDARLVNAQTTDVAAGARLKADALVQGNGGTVVVWSDGATRYRGSISAQGGAAGGNGGLAEVSGKGYLDFQGLADLRAAQGKRGTLLLDPLNITVGACADITGASCGYGSDITSGIELSDPASYAGLTSYITATAVESLLNTTDVTLAATNDININSAINKSGSTATTLTLNAGNDINLNASVGTYAGALGFVATAGNNIWSGYGASVTSRGGNISLTAVGSISAGTLNATGADASSGTAGAGGTVSLTASTGNIDVSSVLAKGGSGSSGNTNGGAGGAIVISAASDCGSECSSNIYTISAAGGNGYGAGVGGAAGGVSITMGHWLNTNAITASSLSYSYSTGAIDLSGTSLTGVQSLNLTAASGITATTSGVSSFRATVTGSGDVSYTNTGALTIQGIQVASGNIVVDNTGALETIGAIKTGSGTVSLTAHSPITIGAGGISATGNVSLSAPTANAGSNITINGAIQSTAGGVSMAAYNNLTQNSYVYGATGVAANTTSGAIAFGPNGYSGGSPLSYSAAGAAVTPPLVPVSALTSTGSTVADFLDQFLAALDQQQTFSDDPFDPRNRSRDALVVEGQICTP